MINFGKVLIRALSRLGTILIPKKNRFSYGLLVAVLAAPILLTFNNCSMSGIGGFQSEGLDPNELLMDSVRSLNSAVNFVLPTQVVNGRTMYVCDPTVLPKTPSEKLSNREFKNAIQNLLYDFALSPDVELSVMLDQLPSDKLVQDQNTIREQTFLITKQMAAAYFNASFKTGALVAASTNLGNYPNTGNCLSANSITQACHQLFVREFGSRAFRRKLAVQEGNIIAATAWDASLGKADLLQLTVTTLLQSPDFMYKTYDQGNLANRGPTAVTLRADELAAKLSFFLTGSLPDDTLKALANSGAILNTSTLSGEVDRLLGSAAGVDLVHRMFRESYGYDYFDKFQYSGDFLNGLDASGLQDAMSDELDHYFDNVVLNRNGNFRDLMTSTESVINSDNLAQIYEFGSAPGAVNLPAKRAGFLNRAAMLAKHSGNSTSPVKRGVEILRGVLCGQIGNPPPSAPATFAPVDPSHLITTRERYHNGSEQPGTSCIFCHTRMNNLGYPFESFDSIGRYRTVERIFTVDNGPSAGTLPVDTTATTNELVAGPLTVQNSSELVGGIGQDQKAMTCLIKHVKEFESRAPASVGDACQMNESLTALYGTVGSPGGTPGTIKQAIKGLVLSNDFRIWNY